MARKLEAAIQGEAQARAELARVTAMTADHEPIAEHLRLAVAEQDQEIHQLRQRLLDGEEIRADGAAALRTQHDDTARKLETTIQSESQVRAQLATATAMIADHESVAEQLRLVVAERDQEIHQLRQRLLDAEEARVADAAAFLESLQHKA